MTAEITTEILDLDGAARLREAWQDLADRSLDPSVFNEPAFLLAALRYLARHAPPVVLATWKRIPGAPARLIGLCPVAFPRWPGPLPARAWSHRQATAAYPLLDRSDARLALTSLLAAVRRGPGKPAGLLMAGLDTHGSTADVLRSTPCPHAWLEPRSRAVLLRDGQAAGLRGSGRKELRRQWNRLAEKGCLAVASARAPDEVMAALGRFLDLEARGWKGRRRTAFGNKSETRAFAEAAIGDLAASGRCRIDSLSLDDSPVAAGIVLRSADRAFFWKTAYDEALARFSPGLQLASRITEAQLADRDLDATDSCAIPGHSMIDRLWPDRWQVADCLVATETTASAALVRIAAVERGRRDMRALAKRIVGIVVDRSSSRGERAGRPKRPKG